MSELSSILSKYRCPQKVHELTTLIHKATTKPWYIMEICGGQTHSIAKYGLLDLLPTNINLIHGPGCPVCVTSKQIIDSAITIAKQPNVLLCSFGDMLRVPGSQYDLLTTKAFGHAVTMIYSPLDAIKLAQENPDKEIVLFAIGFETTAPTHAQAVRYAYQLGLNNFSIVPALVLVPPAMRYLLDMPDNQVQGFLAAGHVCTIMGDSAYKPIAKQYKVPIVMTGFEPVDILIGLLSCIKQLENNQAEVENQYNRLIEPQGNSIAQNIINEVFECVDTHWRGIGLIPNSGLKLAPKYEQFDAILRFESSIKMMPSMQSDCISGLILQGKKKPTDCPFFGKQCTPNTPMGAPMVSTEGACSAYYLYQRDKHVT